jgi:hypothetical protein
VSCRSRLVDLILGGVTRSRGIIVLAAILVVGVFAAVVPASGKQPGRTGSVVGAAAATFDQHVVTAKDGRGGGPPAWARANGHGKGRGSDKSWKEAWHQLTPAQRQDKMAALIQTHEQGMRQWADCVAAAGSDPSTRATCVKPLPPGLAKKGLQPG